MNKLKLIFLLGLFASCSSSKTVINSSKPVKNQNTTKPVKPAPNTPPAASVTTTPTEEIFRTNLPEIKREFRGAWIASVANINWPSKAI